MTPDIWPDEAEGHPLNAKGFPMHTTSSTDAAAVLAEFGTASTCGVQQEPGGRRLYRAHDGFGCSGFGSSYDEAAANLRTARAEHRAHLLDLERLEAQRRERFARILANVAFWLAIVLAIVAGIRGGVQVTP